MKTKLTIAVLHHIGISHKKLHEISKQKIDFQVFHESLSLESLRKIWFSVKQCENILENHEKFWYQDLKDFLKEHNAHIILFSDEQYPESLKNIHNPPYILYIQWKINNSPKFSVVWSRKISSYGKKCIEYIIPEIGKYFEIVSWWALGCDTVAHKVSLDHNIPTIVVVWTGLDECYPVSNKWMYEKVVKNGGAIISIFPFTDPWSKYNFPVRNEIVAWLSLWTLIVEAQERSGSLITANLALDLGKDLFACPGDIFLKNSSGCNTLISQGSAKIVCHPTHILSEYNIAFDQNSCQQSNTKKYNWADVLEKAIYELLLWEKLTIDELLQKLDTDIRNLSLKISLLEIGWYIQKTVSWKYELK